MRSHGIAALATVVTSACAPTLQRDVPEQFAPSAEQILTACMKVQVPHALQSLGIDPRVRTREDAAAKAYLICKEVVGFCAPMPNSETCRTMLASYGLGPTNQRPSVDESLFGAAHAGRTELVRRLLTEGGNPNWRNFAGWTPLMIAAAERHLDTVQVLLDAKADPNQRNAYGRTALMFASSYGQLAIVQALLAAGADPNVVANDATGWTALVAAASKGEASVVEALLKGGANPRLRTRDGRLAIDYAREAGHDAIVKLLEAATATAS